MDQSNYLSYQGTVKKTKIIQAKDPTMVYFTLETNDQQAIPCLIAHEALTFLLEVTVGDTISIYGHYNQRQQFIVKRYLSAHKAYNQQDGLRDYPSHLYYPSQTPQDK